MNMLLPTLALALGALSAPAVAADAHSGPVAAAVTADPPRNEAHPARNRQLLIPSQGHGMNALFFLASGEGAKPTLLLLHGLPGNERNLDLAQAVRRAGWNVLTFTYRGAWGSPGAFSLANALEDVDSAMALLQSPEAARTYNVDRRRIVVGGHSLGGFNAAMHVAANRGAAGLVLIDAANFGATSAEVRAAGADGLAELEAGLADDFGNSLVGTSPKALATEWLSHNSDWDLLQKAPQLARVPVLSVYATHGGRAENVALANAIQSQPGARLTSLELGSDHAFADHRIALGSAIVNWLTHMPK